MSVGREETSAKTLHSLVSPKFSCNFVVNGAELNAKLCLAPKLLKFGKIRTKYIAGVIRYKKIIRQQQHRPLSLHIN